MQRVEFNASEFLIHDTDGVAGLKVGRQGVVLDADLTDPLGSDATALRISSRTDVESLGSWLVAAGGQNLEPTHADHTTESHEKNRARILEIHASPTNSPLGTLLTDRALPTLDEHSDWLSSSDDERLAEVAERTGPKLSSLRSEMAEVLEEEGNNEFVQIARLKQTYGDLVIRIAEGRIATLPFSAALEAGRWVLTNLNEIESKSVFG